MNTRRSADHANINGIGDATDTPSPPRKRRRWLGRLLLWGTGAVLIVVVVVVGVVAWLYSRARADTFGEVDFVNELAIPPVLEPEVDDEGRSVFALDLQSGTTEFKPGTTTETWGVNGTYLGPTIRASRGDEVVMNVHNELPEPTTLHWHGMHLPAAADGGPHSMIEVGDTWSPTWEIDQPAATLWYHPHPHGVTAKHVYRGIAGMFIIDDENTPDELPADYGVDDIPVIVQDKAIGDGLLDPGAPLLSPVGQLDDEILVNGTLAPYVEVSDELVRLRVLNASNARVYNLGFDDDRTFELVGTDGGLLEETHTTSRIQVSPGERVEIVARFEPGERTVLRSYSPELDVDFFSDRFGGGDDRFDLLEIRAGTALEPSPDLPAALAADTLPEEADAVTTRQFELNGRTRINGERMEMSRIDEVVAAGTTEVWEVTNGAGGVHNFHVHDVQFRIVSYDGDAPPPELAGPKDTVFLRPGVTARLVVRFGNYTDPEFPYMFHCHILRHEDSGMMGQFTVVAPDDVDTAPRTIDVHDH